MADRVVPDPNKRATLVQTVNGMASKAAVEADRHVLEWISFEPSYYKYRNFTWAINRAPSGDRPLLFDWAAIYRLIEALGSGQIPVSAIPESSSFDGWQDQTVPPGFFRGGRWRLYRIGSRLTALDSRGHDTAPAWSDVRLAPLPADVRLAPLPADVRLAPLPVHDKIKIGRDDIADRRKAVARALRANGESKIAWKELARTIKAEGFKAASEKTMQRDVAEIKKMGGVGAVLGERDG